MNKHITGGDRVKANVLNLKPCECGSTLLYGQTTKEEYTQSYIKCPTCGEALEANMPVNQLTDLFNAGYRNGDI